MVVSATAPSSNNYRPTITRSPYGGRVYSFMKDYMATNRRIVDAKNTADFYPTPTWATLALMDVEDLDGMIWEPACGNGAMSVALKTRYPEVLSSDLHNRNYGIGGWNFLETPDVPGYLHIDHIVTNPPYNLAEDFIHQSLKIARHKVCMLLRLAFLEGQSRYNSLFSECPSARVHAFSERITFYPDGIQTGGSGTTAYGWFVWDKSVTDKSTSLRWIKPGYKAKS